MMTLAVIKIVCLLMQSSSVSFREKFVARRDGGYGIDVSP